MLNWPVNKTNTEQIVDELAQIINDKDRFPEDNFISVF
jgi:hypothetical protein